MSTAVSDVDASPVAGRPEAIDPVPVSEGTRGRRHMAGHSGRLVALVLLAGLLASVVLSLLTNDVVHRSQRSLLMNQSSLSASTIGSLVGQIRSSLDAVVLVAVATGGDVAAIKKVAGMPAMQGYSSLVVLGQTNGTWTPAVVVRPAGVSLTEPAAAMRQMLQAIPSHGLGVIGLVGSGAARTIAIADRPAGADQYEIYVELPLVAASAASSSSKSQPFRDLDFALYLHDSEQADNLLTASTSRLPLTGTRAAVRLDVSGQTNSPAVLSARPADTTGPPEDLLMVFSPKGPLGGSLAADLAWISLLAGVTLSFVAAGGFALILRSRTRALDLISEMQVSTEMRNRAVAERAEAEGQRNRLEGQLRQAQRLEAVGQLAGGIAHDFNNLLAVILNFGHFVLLALHDHPAEDDVKEMIHAAEQAANLTRQLLVFSRKDVVRPEAVDLNTVIDGTVRLLGRTLGEHIDLRLHLDPQLPAVEADTGGLEQVLMNLAVNARDAMAEGGSITISTSVAVIDDSYTDAHVGAAPGTHVLLEVSDTGCGMSPELTLRIFEPFFTTKASGVGTGMGLATVYGIVSRFGGHISVYSEENIGTVFKIWLPAISRPAVTQLLPEARSIAEDGRGQTILLVEDEPAVRRAARRILESAGYGVVEAADGSEAMEAFAKSVPAAVVSDVVMPGGISGKGLVDQFHSVVPDLPVLFMSGYTADIITARGVLDDNVLLIQKPFSADTLLDGVRQALIGTSGGIVPTHPADTQP